jgi:hypothetical protein
MKDLAFIFGGCFILVPMFYNLMRCFSPLPETIYELQQMITDMLFDSAVVMFGIILLVLSI